MAVLQGRTFRLVSRGQAGLACDDRGLALGAVALATVSSGESCERRCEVRPFAELRAILHLAYGPQSDEAARRCHRGLLRAAAALEANDLAQAGVEAVMLGLPDLSVEGTAKLTAIADLEKGGAGWQDQPRVPAGQPGGGEWTSEGGSGSPSTPAARPAGARPGSRAANPASYIPGAR
jgi:hypothetical protein